MHGTPGSAEGQYFIDTEARTRVRLETETDALLAAFVFGGKKRKRRPRIALSVFDDVLKILRDPKFKPDRITLKNYNDVLTYARRYEILPGRRNNSILARAPDRTHKLLADFVFAGNLRPQMEWFMVSELLALLRDTRFRTDQITFASGGDILFHIAEGRRQVARLRSIPLPSNSTAPATNVPEEVMDHVMKMLVGDALRRASAQPYWNGIEFVRFLPSKDLKTASLVHRTWTAPAQRVLRSFVEVDGSTGLYYALRSPLLGPWTRQMRITKSNEEDRRGDVFFLLKSIPQYFSNIAVLSIYLDYESDDHYSCQHADEAILSLGELKRLKSLTVMGCRKPFILWEAIIRMSSLTSLKLKIAETCTFTETEIPIPISFQNKAPSPSLTDIDITQGNQFWPCLPWLFRPHGEYRIKKLSTGFWHKWPEQFSFRFLQPSLPQLEELTITSTETGSAFEWYAREVLSHCSALRILRGRILRPADEFIRADVASVLPKTIESLTLVCYEIRERLSAGDWDARLINFLKVFPNLRAFSFAPIDFPLPETQAFCADHKIQLVLLEREER